MEILQSIGINHTLFIQLLIFLVTYLVVNNLIFKPYFAAFIERKKQTVGHHDFAAEVLEETKSLELEYEKKARLINSEFKTIYDNSKTAALHKYDEIVNLARQESNNLLEEKRKIIAQELEKASQTLDKEMPAVSTVITSKLLGKEVQI